MLYPYFTVLLALSRCTIILIGTSELVSLLCLSSWGSVTVTVL